MPNIEKKAALQMNEMSSAALAYLGDSVLELRVRDHLVRSGLSTAAHLNEASRAFITAPAQAKAMLKLQSVLTEQEAAVYRRGRNNVHANVPKKATMGEYRAATGMECLFAYLHLIDDQARIDELFTLAYLTDETTEPQGKE